MTSDDERMAEIGRAVVQHCMGDNEAAMRQATPERVVAWLKQQQEELFSLQVCHEIQVGRAALLLVDCVKRAQSTRE